MAGSLYLDHKKNLDMLSL